MCSWCEWNGKKPITRKNTLPLDPIKYTQEENNFSFNIDLSKKPQLQIYNNTFVWNTKRKLILIFSILCGIALIVVIGTTVGVLTKGIHKHTL